MAQSKKDIWTACLPKVKQLLGDITGSEITVAACLPQNDTFSSAGLAVITRFTGKASGRIILDMSKETARKLCAVINGQDKGDDEFVVDTITEMGATIAGHIITWLNNGHTGLGLMLTPPGVFVGKRLKVIIPKLDAQIVVFGTSVGYIVLSIGFERSGELWM